MSFSIQMELTTAFVGAADSSTSINSAVCSCFGFPIPNLMGYIEDKMDWHKKHINQYVNSRKLRY